MSTERVYPLDSDTLELFASKSSQGGCYTPQMGNGNGVKVRRVMQITRDFAKAPFDQIRIVDFAAVKAFTPSKQHCVVLKLSHWTLELSE